MTATGMKKRVTASVDEETYARLCYWADKRGYTLNEYIGRAIEMAIRWENRDYDLPTAEQQRLNQLTDLIVALSSDVNNLSRVVTSGFDSLTTLTRGTNYLVETDAPEW